MSLFQKDGEPILFHLINIGNAERASLTELIESEGGGVTEDDKVTVKFTSIDAYVRNGPLVRTQIYNVEFIKDCIRQKKIVNPEDYRLDKKIGRDEFYMQHFLWGKCKDARFRVEFHCEDWQEDSRYRSVAYEVKFSPKETFQRIEDSAMQDVDSRLNGEHENRRGVSRNWYENPYHPLNMESATNVNEKPNDDRTSIDMPGHVAVPSTVPEGHMLAHDPYVVPSTTIQNDSWIGMKSDNEESTHRETATPNFDLVPAPNNHPETVRASDNRQEPVDTIEKAIEHSYANTKKPAEQCRPKESENQEVNKDHERNSSTVEIQGARKKAHRRLPNFREILQDHDDSDDSSISSYEAKIPLQGRIEDTTPPILSEPIVISDENSGDEGPSQRCGYRNANSPGPSGVRNTRKGHIGDELESNESTSFVRNVSHSSFQDNPIEVDDDTEEVEVEVQHHTAKKSRGKEWRAKLKSQTSAQYTGTNSRIPFTSSERKKMLRYLITHKCIGRAKGLVVWKKMITDGYLTRRTPQSLHNHFQKYILPNIEEASWLEDSVMQKFLALRE